MHNTAATRFPDIKKLYLGWAMSSLSRGNRAVLKPEKEECWSKKVLSFEIIRRLHFWDLYFGPKVHSPSSKEQSKYYLLPAQLIFIFHLLTFVCFTVLRIFPFPSFFLYLCTFPAVCLSLFLSITQMAFGLWLLLWENIFKYVAMSYRKKVYLEKLKNLLYQNMT
jgi:hypothetical protein